MAMVLSLRSPTLSLRSLPRAGRRAGRGGPSLKVTASAKSLGKTPGNSGPGPATYKERFEFPLVGARVDLIAEEGNELVAVTIPRPLGITFVERPLPPSSKASRVVVEEVVEGSNAAASDVAAGDVLRLTTAVFTDRGQVNELDYFSNVPKTFNRRAVLVADGQGFDKVMAGLVSNGELIDTPQGGEEGVDEISLILERPSPGGGGGDGEDQE